MRRLQNCKPLPRRQARAKPVRLIIARGRNTLSEENVNFGLGEVVLSLRREDDRLRATVSPTIGEKQQVEYEDFLTLAHSGLPGVWFGSKTTVTEIQLAYRTRPLEQSPIETIKNHINAQQYDEALEMLSLQTGSEADYLRSLCQTQVKDRLEILDFVLAKSPRVDSSGVVLDRWHLPAMIDAIRLNREENNEERFRDLILKLKFYYGTSIDNVATRVPEDLRKNLIAELRKQGGRWRIATQADIDAPMLDSAVHLDSMLESDPVVKRATRWRRCDAWRASGRYDDAIRDLKKLLAETLSDVDAAPGEVANLITDICWVKLAHNKRNEVEDFLAELSDDSRLPADAVNSIRLESARLAANQGRFEDAARQLDDLLKDETKLRIAQHIDACLVAGFVQLDLNNPELAQEFWLRGTVYRGEPIKQTNENASTLHGTEAVEHQCIVTLYGTLASLTNTFTGEAAKESFYAQIPKDGLSGNAAIDIVESMFPIDFIEGVASAIYRSERGTAIARRRAYHQHDLAPYFTEPIRLLVFEGVVVKHLEEYRENAALMDDVWNACDQLFLTYNSRGISEQEDMKAIVSLWAGQAGLETWQALEPKVTRDVSAGLALLAGKAHFSAAQVDKTEALRIMHTRNARTMLQVARDHRGATDNFVALANQLLADIPVNE
jgi:tetratricopeptide (TPR) repeat protein